MVELRYSRIIHVIGSWNEKTEGLFAFYSQQQRDYSQ